MKYINHFFPVIIFALGFVLFDINTAGPVTVGFVCGAIAYTFLYKL